MPTAPEESLDHSHMKGEYQDVITHEDETVEVLPWQRNLIVNNIGFLIAAMMAHDTSKNGPLTWWAVGQGNPVWDVTPASPAPTDTILVSEIYRKAIPNPIGYVDSLGNPSITPTNILQIVLTFGTSEANGTWREFGIFGGPASITVNSGTMINHRIHGSIVKTSSITITRTLRITF